MMEVGLWETGYGNEEGTGKAEVVYKTLFLMMLHMLTNENLQTGNSHVQRGKKMSLVDSHEAKEGM